MSTPSPLPTGGRALAIILLGLAPVLIEAAVVQRVSQSGSSEPNLAERFLDDVFGRSESMAAVKATASAATAYLRIASLSIALYDYITTIPAEWRLYMSQPSITKMSRACILFICVRYMSILALVSSNVGFFGHGFSAEVCKHYQLLAPVTKVFAVLFSQIIVSIRTYAISRKEPWVKWLLITLFVVSLVPEFMGNIYKRKPVQNADKNCTSGNLPTAKIAWIHYLAAVIFDTVVTAISTGYLLMNSPSVSLMSGLSRLMLKEGIAFFILLTAVNILNLVMFRVSSIAAQSSAACLGQAVTMIMSQRIILGLHDWRTATVPSGGTRPDAYELSNNKGRGTGVHVLASSPGTSSGYTPNSGAPLRSFVPEMRRSIGGVGETESGPIHVHVTQDVKEDYDSVFAASTGYPTHPDDTPQRDEKTHWDHPI